MDHEITAHSIFNEPGRIPRRKFLHYAGAVASLTLLDASLVWGTAANSQVNLGMIGCGGRGTWIAGLFLEHGGYVITAAADYFADRVNNLGEQNQVPEEHRFTGLSGYKRLLENNVDAVAIISPPYFHPEQAADAGAAGKHVFLAKPVAVDVPGCLSIQENGKAASENNRCFLVDFQTRANEYYIEAVKRVHQGALGKIINGDAGYQTGRLGAKADPGTPEARLRNWVFDKVLSGDIITEQNIHAIDVACWILNADPVKAYGTGGRKVRTDVGDCWDHFNVVFEFPNATPVSFNSKQAGHGYDDIMCRVYGAEGTIDTHYGGRVMVRGNRPYRGGETSRIYQEGAVNNIRTFHANITEGDFSNPTVAPSVQSNLTTILGRTAAYNGDEVTWKQMMETGERLTADLEGLKS